MGNCCCYGSSTVQHQSPETTKPLPAAIRRQSPENVKSPPPPVTIKTPTREKPKIPATRPVNHPSPPRTPVTIKTPTREKPKIPATRPVNHPSPQPPPPQKSPEKGQAKRTIDHPASPGTVPASGKIVTPDLKMFTLAELRTATRNFRPDSMIGEGGFGRVFKGWVDDKTLSPSKVGVGIPVAVKKSNPDSSQGLHEWQCEVRFLGKFHHPNLVKLLGYCWEDNQFLLVYEYMPKGSLENHLFAKGAEPLTWSTRLKIAIGAAEGLAFLHNSEKSVIYRDFKASNILLDSNFHAKLSDFGLAKLGPINGHSHVTTRVMGTYGYAAPEYMATGHLYVRSDVYGFGVVLLELLTGLRALDPTRPSAQHNLVEWAKPCLTDKKKLKKIMDPRLDRKYPVSAVVQTAALILRCIEADPKNRPSMDEVLKELRAIRVIRDEPKGSHTRGSDKNRRTGSPYGLTGGRTG
ncbi:PREDICTED: probable serine/threonine-protein kinase NAK [Tarenaya hassleriana]|uniref:probable serine/threonine-protein kinase NAK n=1 Tax=Tarenaya hassleriana TaxID=28532 RepID=UPI00053C300A|nr:PREDICTED: probable serine/threonine-protein kinase NAK [Tarenaya hassleriana]XP_010536476.1 PREDICTED: probable serine/threonine-protein kinase NAK [Tarenaya hassleriana]